MVGVLWCDDGDFFYWVGLFDGVVGFLFGVVGCDGLIVLIVSIMRFSFVVKVYRCYRMGVILGRVVFICVICISLLMVVVDGISCVSVFRWVGIVLIG